MDEAVFIQSEFYFHVVLEQSWSRVASLDVLVWLILISHCNNSIFNLPGFLIVVLAEGWGDKTRLVVQGQRQQHNHSDHEGERNGQVSAC